MQIKRSNKKDIPAIFKRYAEATAYQKKRFHRHWPTFERSLIEKEVSEHRQWKIVINQEIACIFAITFDDEQIWKVRSKQPAIYIHRIATNPTFRGKGFVPIIIQWARDFCLRSNKDFIRLDAFGDNMPLSNYYEKCGFSRIDTIHLEDIAGLPAHYKGELGLFEIRVI